MKTRIILTIAALFAVLFTAGAEVTEKDSKVIKGFSGGMMLHTGYLSGCDNPYDFKPSGATFGIGGVAKLHVSEHFRAGFEGYFSTMGLKKEVQSGSFNKLFWTGVLADCFWKIGRFYPYVGATVGGGMETAVYNKKPFFAVDPFVGVEYAVGEALRLTLKADWLLAVNKDGLNRPMGPRMYFGFIFAH